MHINHSGELCQHGEISLDSSKPPCDPKAESPVGRWSMQIEGPNYSGLQYTCDFHTLAVIATTTYCLDAYQPFRRVTGLPVIPRLSRRSGAGPCRSRGRIAAGIVMAGCGTYCLDAYQPFRRVTATSHDDPSGYSAPRSAWTSARPGRRRGGVTGFKCDRR
jgi:hypothetical protein